jgi:hypothetical protein
MTKPMTWLLAVVACASLPSSAREVFRTADENGVVSFSDVASPGAEVIEVAAEPVPDDGFERQRRIIEQQLAVAKALEESRLAREEARAKRQEAFAAAQPPVIQAVPVGGTYVSSLGYRHGYFRHLVPPGHAWKPGHPGRGPHPSRPVDPSAGAGQDGGSRLDPPSRPVPLPPLEPR